MQCDDDDDVRDDDFPDDDFDAYSPRVANLRKKIMSIVDEDGVLIDPPIRTARNYDRSAVSKALALRCSDETRTEQQHKEECDINTIVRNFGLTGTLPTGVVPPFNADFHDVMDYQTALNQLIAAEDSFMAMPAEVRRRFANDPHQFVEFVSDPKNLKECRDLGLAMPGMAPRPPTEVRIVTEDGKPVLFGHAVPPQ